MIGVRFTPVFRVRDNRTGEYQPGKYNLDSDAKQSLASQPKEEQQFLAVHLQNWRECFYYTQGK